VPSQELWTYDERPAFAPRAYACFDFDAWRAAVARLAELDRELDDAYRRRDHDAAGLEAEYDEQLEITRPLVRLLQRRDTAADALAALRDSSESNPGREQGELLSADSDESAERPDPPPAPRLLAALLTLAPAAPPLRLAG
jgi:hypothetical protein